MPTTAAARALLLASWIGVAVATGACSKQSRSPVERGQRTFLRLCSGCHGVNGQGVRQAGFKVPPRDLTDPALHERLSDSEIEATIRNGKGQMPPFGPLMPPEDVKDLVLYVRSLRKPAGT